MKGKFLFFDIKRSFIINVLIILQITFWLFYMSTLVSLTTFKSTYINRYNQFYPTKTGARLVFYKMMLNDYTEGKYYPEIIEDLKKQGVEYGIVRKYYQPSDLIPISTLNNISIDSFKSNFRDDEFYTKSIELVGINYTFLNKQKNYLLGDISEESWVYSNNTIPVIMGNNFANSFKVGDSFTHNNIKYIIKGFFKKGTMISTDSDPVLTSELTDGQLFIPASEQKALQSFEFEPIILYLGDNLDMKIKSVNESLSKISKNLVIQRYDTELENFFKRFNEERLFELIRVIIISSIVTAALIVTISYKIHLNRDRIGIIYAYGGTQKYIFRKICSEILSISLVGVVCGIYLYSRQDKALYSVFLNENLKTNIFISTVILTLIISSIIFMQVGKISKTSPRELIGGFKE